MGRSTVPSSGTSAAKKRREVELGELFLRLMRVRFTVRGINRPLVFGPGDLDRSSARGPVGFAVRHDALTARSLLCQSALAGRVLIWIWVTVVPTDPSRDTEGPNRATSERTHPPQEARVESKSGIGLRDHQRGGRGQSLITGCRSASFGPTSTTEYGRLHRARGGFTEVASLGIREG
jgi:hypothetical protein